MTTSLFSGASIDLVGAADQISARNITLRGAVSTSLPSVLLNASNLLTIHNDINVGTGTLNLISGGADISDGGATTAPILTANTVSLMQDGAFGATPLFTLAANALALEVTAAATDQTVHPWMVAGTILGLSLTTTGAITVSSNIDTGTGDLTLSGTGITLSSSVDSLMGNAISLTGAIMRDTALTVTATGVLTLNSDINLGTGDLIISATGGTTLGGAVMLTAGGITISDGITSVSHALTITAATGLNLVGNINTGTGDLTLDVGSPTGGSFANTVRMLSGNVVTITGAGLAASGDLTISALGNLMVNTTTLIDVETNTLRLEAGRAPGNGAGQTGAITFGSAALILQASRFDLTQDGAIFPTAAPATFRTDATTAAPANRVRISYTGTATQTAATWATVTMNDVTLGGGADFMIMASDLFDGELRAVSSIRLDAGTTGEITFADDVPTSVTIIAPNITINARSINLGTMSLTIIADGGTLTLQVVQTITGTGTASLSLTARTFVGLRTNLTVNVPTVSLALTAPSSSLFSRPFSGTIETLSVSARADQAYFDWMGDTAPNLILTSGGSVSVNEDINLGTGNLTLDGAFGIALGDDITLTGGAISLTGTIGSSNNNFDVIASGALTLNSGINLGSGILTINAGERINVPNSGTNITASAINISFGDSDVTSPEMGFTTADGTATFTNVIFTPPTVPTYAYTLPPVDCAGADACVISSGTLAATLTAMTSIALNFGTEAISFGGGGSHLHLRADSEYHGGQY